jgi:putative heme iron utilization protein
MHFIEDAHLNIPAHAPLHLLHQAVAGTLATHSRQPEGFPYPSILPYAPDAWHRPTILVSRLAEHTRNLQADSRAGLLVAHAPDGDVLNGERVTLLGSFAMAGPTPAVVRRYLRYHPDAERYLALGDFSFWVMTLERIRYIGGFGAMGWLDGTELDPLEPLSFEEECGLLEFFDAHPRRPRYLELLGIDRYGADLKNGAARTRYKFEEVAKDADSLYRAVEDCMLRNMNGS